MTVLSNGYIIQVGSSFVGPFINYDDAITARRSLDANEAVIKALYPTQGVVKVKDCERPECNHCRDIAYEATKAISRNQLNLIEE